MSDQVEKSAAPKVTPLVQFVYGYQEFALGFMTTLGTMYFMFFMTDVALIAPAVVATIMLVARIVDIFSVPTTGFIIQGSNFKKGKYSTWLFIATPLIIVFNLLMFSNLPIAEGPKAVLMGASYICAYFFVNFCSTARFSILPIMTNDPIERTVLSARRGQGMTAGNIIRGLVYVPFVLFLTKATGSQVYGYFFTALIFGIVAISGMYWLAFTAKPFELVAKAKEGPKPTIKDMITQLGTNKPLLLLVLAETMRLGANQVLTSSNMYYFRYVLNNMLMLSVYMVITFGGGFLGNSILGPLVKKMDRKVAYMLGMIIWIAGMTVAYFTSFGNVVVFIVTITIAQFGIGISNASSAAFFSDTSDYGELKQGKNIRAINMGLVIFPIKIGVLLGGSIQAYMLASIGFKAGTEDPVIIRGIHNTATLISAAVAVLAIVFMLLYPLTNKKMTEIRAQLAAKKAA